MKTEASENKVLLVYDSYKEFGSEENKLNSLVHIILSTGNGVDIVNINSFDKKSIDKYETVFILYNNSSKVPGSLIKSLLEFRGKIIWVGRNFNLNLESYRNVKYIPYFSEKDSTYNTLSKYYYDIFNNKKVNGPKVYLLLDKVYPFIDIEAFVKKIDFLYDQGIPFVCSVMPVYENQDFDAMERFCKVLRYAQSKGGKIILHSSILKGNNIPGKDVQDKMSLAQQIYIKYGVYPLALDIPDSFFYKNDYKNLIHSSNDIFVENDKNIGVISFKKYSISGFDKVINKVYISDNYNYEPSQITCDTAFCFDSDLNLDSFKSQIRCAVGNGMYFNNSEYLNNVITLGGIKLSNKNFDKLLNNKLVDNKDSNSKVSEKNNKTVDITNANNRIIKITIGVCILFVIIVLINRRIERRKFFR